jgi:hypothetical protein
MLRQHEWLFVTIEQSDRKPVLVLYIGAQRHEIRSHEDFVDTLRGGGYSMPVTLAASSSIDFPEDYGLTREQIDDILGSEKPLTSA